MAGREAAAVAPALAFRSTKWISQFPREERALATARPIPEAPPVTSATFFWTAAIACSRYLRWTDGLLSLNVFGYRDRSGGLCNSTFSQFMRDVCL